MPEITRLIGVRDYLILGFLKRERISEPEMVALSSVLPNREFGSRVESAWAVQSRSNSSV